PTALPPATNPPTPTGAACMTLRLVLAAVLSTCAATATFAAELPAADQPAEQVIDQVIDAQLAAAGVRPAPQVDDATFIRRATLDLVGRIPTPSEVDAYVKSTDPQKRDKLLHRLLTSPRSSPHQA